MLIQHAGIDKQHSAEELFPSLYFDWLSIAGINPITLQKMLFHACKLEIQVTMVRNPLK